ncbi:hypothetical protein ACIP9H_40350 [Streptomyces sp. NPDC088732]|uniref:hypothetical protein n=1 Tax=Streptomyces sp. NPDC088732 TaxID=3365879 RepID=UPI00381A2B23
MPEPITVAADLRAQLAEAAEALCAVGKAAIVVQPTLDKPYPHAPQWTPWTRWMQRPARQAYNLGTLLRRQLGLAVPTPHYQSNEATRLYDAARQHANETVGHAEGCEWHTKSHAYCTCLLWLAARAGVDAALEALGENTP